MMNPDYEMRQPTALSQYPRPIIFLHWATLFLLVASAGCVFGLDLAGSRTSRLLLISCHRNIGLLIFGVVVARLVIRMVYRSRMPSHDLTAILHVLSSVVQAAIYGLLLILPLLGWALSNAHGTAVAALGLLPLPSIVGLDLDLADSLEIWHTWGAWLLYALVAVHAGAALWHHYLRRDEVLTAMWPKALARTASGR